MLLLYHFLEDAPLLSFTSRIPRFFVFMSSCVLCLPSRCCIPLECEEETSAASHVLVCTETINWSGPKLLLHWLCSLLTCWLLWHHYKWSELSLWFHWRCLTSRSLLQLKAKHAGRVMVQAVSHCTCTGLCFRGLLYSFITLTSYSWCCVSTNMTHCKDILKCSGEETRRVQISVWCLPLLGTEAWLYWSLVVIFDIIYLQTMSFLQLPLSWDEQNQIYYQEGFTPVKKVPHCRQVTSINSQTVAMETCFIFPALIKKFTILKYSDDFKNSSYLNLKTRQSVGSDVTTGGETTCEGLASRRTLSPMMPRAAAAAPFELFTEISGPEGGQTGRRGCPQRADAHRQTGEQVSRSAAISWSQVCVWTRFRFDARSARTVRLLTEPSHAFILKGSLLSFYSGGF